MSIAVQADGKILAGGNFTSIGGQTRNRIARLDPTTGLADSFNPNANNLVSFNRGAGGRQDSSGRRFHTLAPNGGATVTRNHIARLETDGRLDQTLNLSTVGNSVFRHRRSAGRQDSHRRQFYQRFGRGAQQHCPVEHGRHARHGFQPERERCMSIQSRCRRTARFWWAALSPASADRRATASPGSMPRPAWLIRSTRTRTVLSMSIAVQADGKILVGGAFTSIGGQTRNRIARLDPTTGLADSFNPNANDTCPFNRGAGGRQDFGGRRFHAASADRRATASPGSIPRPAWLIRSTRTRTTDVYSIAVQADGKILAGGDFTSIGGQTRNRIARLDATTGLADSFNPNANSNVYSIAVQADGKILAGGSFHEQHRRTDAQPHRPARCHDRLG